MLIENGRPVYLYYSGPDYKIVDPDNYSSFAGYKKLGCSYIRKKLKEGRGFDIPRKVRHCYFMFRALKKTKCKR